MSTCTLLTTAREIGSDSLLRCLSVTSTSTREKSATISAYAIDQVSGTLRLVGQYPTGKGSNWVEIVSFD